MARMLSIKTEGGQLAADHECKRCTEQTCATNKKRKMWGKHHSAKYINKVAYSWQRIGLYTFICNCAHKTRLGLRWFGLACWM